MQHKLAAMSDMDEQSVPVKAKDKLNNHMLFPKKGSQYCHHSNWT